MMTTLRAVGSALLLCGIAGLAGPLRAQGSGQVYMIRTGPRTTIPVRLQAGALPPDQAVDWARLLFRRVREGTVTAEDALLAIAWLRPARGIAGSTFLEISLLHTDSGKPVNPRVLDPDASEFGFAAALASLGPAIRPSLLRTLSAEDHPSAVLVALGVLNRNGRLPPDATIQLVRLLSNSHPAVRREAARSFLNLAEPIASPFVIPALRSVLQDQDIGVRRAAAVSLTRIDPSNPDGVRAMIRVLEGGASSADRISAAYALGEIGRPAAAAGPRLVAMLISEDQFQRDAAITALSSIGEPVIPHVIPLLDARNEAHALAASLVLSRIGEPAVQPVFARFSRFGSDRDAAFVPVIVTLVKLGSPAVPALVGALRRSDSAHAVWAAHALGLMGPTAEPAIPALRTAAQSGNPALRREATEALSKIRRR